MEHKVTFRFVWRDLALLGPKKRQKMFARNRRGEWIDALQVLHPTQYLVMEMLIENKERQARERLKGRVKGV